jgi:hypothetical protein
MDRVQDNAPPLSDEERDWIAKNAAAQRERHEKIVAEMEALAPQRDEWIDGFFGRIQTRGFNHNGDARTKIDKDELPEKPDRPFKVVF